LRYSLQALALLVLAGAVAAQRAARDPSFELTVIQVPGATSATAVAANELGQVVGTYMSNGFEHAFLWSEVTGVVDLGDVVGEFTSSARDVNRLGMVVGLSGGATLWSGVGPPASLPPLPGAVFSEASGIDRLGRVVGWAALPGNVNTSWIWDPIQGTRDLATLGAPARTAADINGAGEIACSFGFSIAVRFDLATSTLHQCGSLGGISEATGLNDLGHVIGWELDGAFRMQPFRWTPELGQQFLGLLIFPQPFGGTARAINNHDEIVGGYGVSWTEAHAFLWNERQGMRDLNDLVPHHPRYRLISAEAITDHGLIAGTLEDKADGDRSWAFAVRMR